MTAQITRNAEDYAIDCRPCGVHSIARFRGSAFHALVIAQRTAQAHNLAAHAK